MKFYKADFKLMMFKQPADHSKRENDILQGSPSYSAILLKKP